MSRWKSSVGSSSLSESSSLFSCDNAFLDVIDRGISETMDSSFVINFLRLEEAVEARESRDSVKDASMGVTRYVFVP